MKKQILLTLLSSLILINSINSRPGPEFDKFIVKRGWETAGNFVDRMRALATALYSISMYYLAPSDEECKLTGGRLMRLQNATIAISKSLIATLNKNFGGIGGAIREVNLEDVIREVKGEASTVKDKEGEAGALKLINERYQVVRNLIPGEPASGEKGKNNRKVYGVELNGDPMATLPIKIF